MAEIEESGRVFLLSGVDQAALEVGVGVSLFFNGFGKGAFSVVEFLEGCIGSASFEVAFKAIALKAEKFCEICEGLVEELFLHVEAAPGEVFGGWLE